MRSKALSLEEEEYARWIEKLRRVVEEIRMFNEAICGNCGKSLKNSDDSLNIRMRRTYNRGYGVWELFCTHYGAVIVEQEPRVKNSNVSLEQEAQALAPPRGSGYDIITNEPKTPPPFKKPESEDNNTLAAKTGMSDKELIYFVSTCGSCPHLKNHRYDVPEKSGRKCVIKRQYPICKWWEEERLFLAVKTGELLFSEDYEYVYRHFENLRKKKELR